MWGRVLQFGVIFLPVSLLHLCMHITGHSARRVMMVALQGPCGVRT